MIENRVQAQARKKFDDAELARALIAGQREAAPSAWKRFQPVVETTLRRMLGSSDDLADLTQEVFLRFFGKIRELKKLEAVRPFVTAIAIRRAREEIKRRRVRRCWAPVVEYQFELASAVEWDPARHQLLGHVRGVMEQLSAADRVVYALRYIEGLELNKIAKVLEMSVSTVRRRIRRASQRIDRLLQLDPVLAAYQQRPDETARVAGRG